MGSYIRAAYVIVNTLRVDSDRVLSGERVPGFNIEFKVKQSLTSKENTADIKIYNLGAYTRELLSGKKVPAKHYAVSFEGIELNPYKNTHTMQVGGGYVNADQGLIKSYPEHQRPLGTVFKGEFKRVWHEKSETDWITNISASDGHEAKQAIINKSFGPGVKMNDLIAEMAKKVQGDNESLLGYVKKKQFGKIVEFIKGKTLSGSVTQEMDKIAKSAGFDWSIVNGEMIILNPDEVVPGMAVKLNEDTGLLGSPEPFYHSKMKSRTFVKCKSLLNAGLHPGRAVILNSRDYSGSFKVINSEHEGNVNHGNFHSEVVLMELAKGTVRERRA